MVRPLGFAASRIFARIAEPHQLMPRISVFSLPERRDKGASRERE